MKAFLAAREVLQEPSHLCCVGCLDIETVEEVSRRLGGTHALLLLRPLNLTRRRFRFDQGCVDHDGHDREEHDQADGERGPVVS
jgi:hypothetical protein